VTLPDPWVVGPAGELEAHGVQRDLEYLDEALGVHHEVVFLNSWAQMGGYELPRLQVIAGRAFLNGTVDGVAATTFTALQIPESVAPLTSAIIRFPTSYWSGGANVLGSGDVSSGTRGLVRLFNNADAYAQIRYVSFCASWPVPIA
jgi:hypothetical protein